jgi:DNA-binding response OmpR family regulator
MRILLVDDYAALMPLMAAALDHDPDHQVDTATDGREGLRKATGDRYDLVVLNLRLREIDGPEFLAAVRRLLPRQRLLVLAEAVDESAASALRGLGVPPGRVVLGTRDRQVLARRIGEAMKPPA